MFPSSEHDKQRMASLIPQIQQGCPAGVILSLYRTPTEDTNTLDTDDSDGSDDHEPMDTGASVQILQRKSTAPPPLTGLPDVTSTDVPPPPLTPRTALLATTSKLKVTSPVFEPSSDGRSEDANGSVVTPLSLARQFSPNSSKDDSPIRKTPLRASSVLSPRKTSAQSFQTTDPTVSPSSRGPSSEKSSRGSKHKKSSRKVRSFGGSKSDIGFTKVGTRVQRDSNARGNGAGINSSRADSSVTKQVSSVEDKDTGRAPLRRKAASRESSIKRGEKRKSGHNPETDVNIQNAAKTIATKTLRRKGETSTEETNNDWQKVKNRNKNKVWSPKILSSSTEPNRFLSGKEREAGGNTQNHKSQNSQRMGSKRNLPETNEEIDFTGGVFHYPDSTGVQDIFQLTTRKRELKRLKSVG